MNKELRALIYWMGLGMSLIAYAHTTFATKERVKTMHEDIRIIQADVKTILFTKRAK